MRGMKGQAIWILRLFVKDSREQAERRNASLGGGRGCMKFRVQGATEFCYRCGWERVDHRPYWS